MSPSVNVILKTPGPVGCRYTAPALLELGTKGVPDVTSIQKRWRWSGPLRPAALFATIALLAAGGRAQQAPDSLLQTYITQALQISPRLRALREKEEAYARRAPQVSGLPDPRATFSLNNMPLNTFSFTQEPMTGKTVSLSQEFPFPGKLSTREQVARADQLVVQDELGDTQNEIIRDVKQAYYEIAYLREAIRIQEQSREVLRGLSRTVRTKYEVGRGSQQDIIKSDLEISRVGDKLLKLRELYAAAAEQLNALLLRQPQTVLPVDTLRPPGGAVPADTSLLQSAREHRPFLKGVLDAARKAHEQKALADLAWYPDFTLGVSYTQRDYSNATGMDFVDFGSVSLSINIPLNYGGKRSSASDEAESLERMYTAQYESALQSLQKMFGTSAATLLSIRDRLNLLETGLLPQASQALNASLAGYQVGEVDYLSVLDNQVKLFQIEDDVYRLRANYWKELANIEFLTGTEEAE